MQANYTNNRPASAGNLAPPLAGCTVPLQFSSPHQILPLPPPPPPARHTSPPQPPPRQTSAAQGPAVKQQNRHNAPTASASVPFQGNSQQAYGSQKSSWDSPDTQVSGMWKGSNLQQLQRQPAGQPVVLQSMQNRSAAPDNLIQGLQMLSLQPTSQAGSAHFFASYTF